MAVDQDCQSFTRVMGVSYLIQLCVEFAIPLFLLAPNLLDIPAKTLKHT